MENAGRGARRDDVNAKAREAYHAGIRKVPPRVLEVVRRDTRYEERRGIRDYAVCRVCGAMLKRVTNHLPRLHNLNGEKYHKQFPNAPLVCSKLRAQLSIAGNRTKREFRGLARRGMSSVRGYPGQKPAREWSIVLQRVEGKTTTQIGSIVKRHHDWVKVICRRLGLTGTSCPYDLGSPMTMERMAKLYEAVGLGRDPFARVFGIPPGLIHGMSRTKLHLRIAAAPATSIIKVRDEMIQGGYDLTKHKGGARRWAPSAARLLRSLVPDFRRVSATLRDLLDRSRRFLKPLPEAGAEQWQNWLCDQARREVAGLIPGKRFTHFLPLAAELSEFIDLSALRKRGDLWRLSMEILAVRFRVSLAVTSHCERDRPLAPRDVRTWILERRFRQFPPSTAAVPALAKARRKRGERGLGRETEPRIKLAAAASRLGKKGPEAAPRIFPRKTKASAEASYWDLWKRFRAKITAIATGLSEVEAHAIWTEASPQ